MRTTLEIVLWDKVSKPIQMKYIDERVKLIIDLKNPLQYQQQNNSVQAIIGGVDVEAKIFPISFFR